MSERPSIEAVVLAELLEAAPGRVRKKLDADPMAADGWTWDQTDDAWVVRVGDEAVTISGGVVSEGALLACSCLLSPRCFHLLAVANVLPVATAADAPGDVGAPAPAVETDADGDAVVELTDKQRRAAAATWQAASRLLAVGASSADALVRADLLRAAHACRDAGLPRLASSAVRVSTGVRDLAAASSSFRLAPFADGLAECLVVSNRLGGAGPPPTPRAVDIGIGRRAYDDIGSLEIHGLFTEAVATASGYAGVVTYAVDPTGRLWSVSDVAPGDRSRVQSAYHAAVRLGPMAISHGDLARARLFVQGATASRDGRLGSGASVRATTAGTSAWNGPVLQPLWARRLDDQLDRVWAAVAEPTDQRPAGWDLVFLDAVVAGVVDGGLLLAVTGENPATPVQVRGITPAMAVGSIAGQNLRLLASSGRGRMLRWIARVRLDQPRTLDLLAVGNGEEPALRLLDAWNGRVHLALDRLSAANFADDAGREPAPTGAAAGEDEAADHPAAPVWSREADPLEPFDRRLQRLALGGRSTLRAAPHEQLTREAAVLDTRQLPTAGRLLLRMADDARATRRSVTGEEYAPPPDELARSWSGAMTYAAAAHRTFHRRTW